MLTDVTLYFAYGSNLGESALRTRCPNARQVGIARAAGYRIGFTRTSVWRGGGVADLVQAPGEITWGSVFELRDDGFAALDKYEGRPKAYDRHIWSFQALDGSTLTAWVYLVTTKNVETLPSHDYWRIIVAGANEARLPEDYVAYLQRLPRLPAR